MAKERKKIEQAPGDAPKAKRTRKATSNKNQHFVIARLLTRRDEIAGKQGKARAEFDKKNSAYVAELDEIEQAIKEAQTPAGSQTSLLDDVPEVAN